MSYLTRAYHAAKLFTTTNAPTIMVVSGVASMTVGSVVGAKKTLQIEDVLAKHAEKLELVEQGEAMGLESYTKDLAQKDRITVYTRASIDLGKLYAVPIVFFVGGATLVFGGHHMLLKRNATLAVAFTGLKKSFDAYRERVREELGEGRDLEFMTGKKATEVTHEDGTVYYEIEDDGRGEDLYNRIFEQGVSESWKPDLDLNRMFLEQQRKFAQQLLNRREYLYLSDVYTALGFEETDVSRVVGWRVKTLPDGTKDIPFIDFGLNTPHPLDQALAQDAAIYLDFNCQGLIVGGKVQQILENNA